MKPRTKLLLAALALALFAWAGVALAQGTSLAPFIPDLRDLFANPFALAVAIGAAVEFVKQHLLKSIEGTAVVFVSLLVGALMGLGGHLAGYLAGSLVEGVAFGVVAAFIASGGYDLLRALLAKWNITLPEPPALTAPTANAQLVALPVQASAAQPVGFLNPTSVTDFLLSLVRGRFGDAVPPFVWGLLETLANEFAGRALTPDVQREIQHRFLDLLAKSGAPGRDL